MLMYGKAKVQLWSYLAQKAKIRCGWCFLLSTILKLGAAGVLFY